MRESRPYGSVRGDRGNPVPYRDNGIVPAKPATVAPWRGWVFEGSGDLLRCSRRWWLGNHRAREPESSISSRSIGVSLQPAIPRRVAPQQSPPPLHRSPTM